MAEVGNLDIYLGVTLVYFREVGNLLEKIIDLLTIIMIKVFRLTVRCFYFYKNF